MTFILVKKLLYAYVVSICAHLNVKNLTLKSQINL